MNLRNLALAATALIAFGGAATAAEKSAPVGTISISDTQFGFLVGGSTGGGKLVFKGKTYKFKIGGLSVGNIGVSKTRGKGGVYDMTEISQFAGTYSKLEASATLVKGAGSLRLKNDKGVVIQLETTSGGLQLAAGAGGVKISLAK